jgi:hypothetical protein
MCMFTPCEVSVKPALRVTQDALDGLLRNYFHIQSNLGSRTYFIPEGRS